MFDPDELFFRQLDPFYHFKHASLTFYCEQANHLRVTDQNGEQLPFPENLFDNVPSVKASSIRFTRYHQAETLLTVILGSFPHGPVVLVSKNPKLRIRDVATEIAARKIPANFSVTKNGGQPVTFEEWLTYKITGQLSAPDDNAAIKEVIDFVVLEASFFSKSDSFVAYKHGCLISEKHPKFTVEMNPGNWVDVLNLRSSIGWVNCEVKAGKISAISFGAEELDPQNDIAITLLSGMIVETVKNRMTAKLDGKETWDITLPNNLAIKSQIPQNFKMRVA
jgi:hypothetical protein